MIERRCAGTVPAKPHTQLRGPQGALRHEECITRGGFDGPFTILYHEERPHTALPASISGLGIDDEVQGRLALATTETPRLLARRHFRGGLLESSGNPLSARRPLLFNRDVVVSLLRPTTQLDAYSVNGDADELYYVQRGGGVLHSVLGEVEFSEGDYLCIPRGIIHRFELGSDEQLWLLIECAAPIEVPNQYRNPVGQLRMDAPYSHRDFRGPRFVGPRDEGLRTLVVQRDRHLHGFELGHSALDVVGWDGALYPWAFSIHDFQPKVGRVHLPPTIHGTFATRGALICSFVPRPLDFGAGAIPCPYPHASVDVDEVIFYARGGFGSRRGIGEASISLHPAGIAHGPHPGKYESSAEEATRAWEAGAPGMTDELAVMLDCADPLRATVHAVTVEDPDYHASFGSLTNVLEP